MINNLFLLALLQERQQDDLDPAVLVLAFVRIIRRDRLVFRVPRG